MAEKEKMEKALKRDIILRNGRRKYVDKLMAELYEKLANAHEVSNIKDRLTEIKYSIWEEFEPISKLDAQILDSIIEIQIETEAERWKLLIFFAPEYIWKSVK